MEEARGRMAFLAVRVMRHPANRANGVPHLRRSRFSLIFSPPSRAGLTSDVPTALAKPERFEFQTGRMKKPGNGHLCLCSRGGLTGVVPTSESRHCLSKTAILLYSLPSAVFPFDLTV